MRDVSFNDDYFANRLQNDSARLKSFERERQLLGRLASNPRRTLDIGCSTGEFASFMGFSNVVGVEPATFAADIARKNGIDVKTTIFDVSGTFDLVVLRGVVQHLFNPFEVLAEASKKLNPGGIMAFLATPNCDSIYFRTFGSLPALDEPKVYLFPTERVLTNFLSRHDVGLEQKFFPYLRSGYASPSDLPRFLGRLVWNSKRLESAFPGNMMDLIFRKKDLPGYS